MSKCWYCNNELTNGDSPKHFGICNKCYDKMFKSGDTIIRSFTNKISDLQSQLAITEKALELLKYQPNYYMFVNENTETIDVDLAISKAKEMIKSE